MKVSSLFENVVLGSLKSYFQVEHQHDNNIYLTKVKALHHSRESTGWKLLWCNLVSLAFMAYMTLESISVHFSWLE